MKVYFVRHGQTALNIERKFQHRDTQLSEEGNKQVEILSRRFNHITAELILSSPYTRALQTAQVIERTLHVPVIQSELLAERHFPSEFNGKSEDDPEVISIHNTIRQNFEDPTWHYSDEENFTDLLSRAKDALRMVSTQEKKSVTVVTHGYFLMLLVCVILFGEDANYQQFKKFKDNSELSNTGLTMCEYKNEKWKLLTLNDYAHLGE